MQSASPLRSSLLVLALFIAAAGRGATLSERAAAIDAPARGSEATLAGPLKVGRAEIVPAAGTRVRVLTAGGVPCGLAFEGPAQLRYRIEDRFSVPVAERNVRRFSSLKTKRLREEAEVLEIAEELSGAVVWGWGLTPAGGTEMAASGSGLPDWAAKLLAGRRFAPPSHDLLAAEANGLEGARYALLRGDLIDLLLHVDPRAAEEKLYRLAKGTDPGQTGGSGRRAWWRSRSRAPGGSGRRRSWWPSTSASRSRTPGARWSGSSAGPACARAAPARRSGRRTSSTGSTTTTGGGIRSRSGA